MVMKKEKEAEQALPAGANIMERFYSASAAKFDEGFMAKNISAQLAQKTSDIERLRRYITQLEEGEKGIVSELTRQLALKDEEISRVSSLYSKSESENRKLSAAFEAHVASQRGQAEKIKLLLLKKEQENTQQISRLGQEIEKKEAEVSSLRLSAVERAGLAAYARPSAAVLLAAEEKVKGLERALSEERRLFRLSRQQYEQRIEVLSAQLGRATAFVVEKENLVRSLESAFESRLAAKEDEQQPRKLETREIIRSRPSSIDAHAARIIGRLKEQLEARDAEASALREKLLLKEPGASAGAGREELERVRNELAEKTYSIARLEKSFTEEQKLSKAMQARLREQAITASSQLETLKSFLIEKERTAQELEAAFEKRIAAKEEEIRHIKAGLARKPEMRLRSTMEKLESELQVKEESSIAMAEEIAALREQAGLLRKRLEERQRLCFESEKSYEELIENLRGQHDARLKSVVQEASKKEAALTLSIGEERAKLRLEKTLIREKEKQIEETLLAFNTTSQKLIALGSPSGSSPEITELSALKGQLAEKEKSVNEREKYLSAKEEELKNMLSSTEEKIAELNSKDATIERKEQLLLKEQEALNKELEVLANAGIEISKSKEYIKQKLDKIGVNEPAETTAQIQAPRRQMAAQELGFEPASEVHEAQEENETGLPKFIGITSQTVEAAPAEELSEENAQEGLIQIPAPKIAAAKARTVVKNLARKAPAAPAKKEIGKKGRLQKRQKPKAPAEKPLPKQQAAPAQQATRQNFPAAAQPLREMPIGARDADEHSGKELFTEIGGYSEIDEIKSVIDVGLQHGDSIEQINESLLASGYSKANVEKVLSGIKNNRE